MAVATKAKPKKAVAKKAAKKATPRKAVVKGDGHGNRRYPWDKWEDGEEHTVVEGKDFDNVTADVMRGMILRRAYSLGRKCETTVIGATDSRAARVKFRFGANKAGGAPAKRASTPRAKTKKTAAKKPAKKAPVAAAPKPKPKPKRDYKAEAEKRKQRIAEKRARAAERNEQEASAATNGAASEETPGPASLANLLP